MTRPDSSPIRSTDGGSTAPRGSREPSDYVGAVYGSLLAASVIAASGLEEPHPRLSLILLLVITGTVFWMAHVYAHLVGERGAGNRLNWQELRRVGRHERPIVEAAGLPALAVLVSPWLGAGENAWLALATAVAQQVTWASLGAWQAGASKRQITVEAVVNLGLGLLIVMAKVTVGH